DDIAAADLNYRRKLFEAETDWRDLTQRFVEAMNRLKLAREIELSQKEKLEYERERLKRGRTTTSQVILFEQDNAVAQLTRLQAQLEALSVLATLKSFGETP
ncbi:MAG: TolC family protein, partial [Deltaproteobacteria bacterium]|nr:TolC family protein [Deltaproteobacteria bacterium]